MNSIKESGCNFCGCRNYRIILKQKLYSVVSCSKCDLYYLKPQPNKEKIKSLYKESYFNAGLNKTGYSNYIQMDNELNLEAHKRLKLIKHYIKGGKLLDVGCGFGHFLKITQKNGFDVTGIDISDEAIKQIRKHNIKGKVGDVTQNSLPKTHFDVITAWDVIEHFNNPKVSLKALANRQRKNDYLFITTPSIDRWDAKLLGKNWYGFKRIPEHLYFFSNKTIKNYLEISGYNILIIQSWGFYRNLNYSIDQISRYSNLFYNLFKITVNFLKIKKKTFFFPIIDMFIIAQKK